MYRRRPELLKLILSSLAGLGGCQQLEQLSIYAVQPVNFLKRAADSHVGINNRALELSGYVIDESGQLLDQVTLNAKVRTVTRRKNGVPDEWSECIQQFAISGKYDLNFKNCQTVDLQFEKVGYFNERLLVAYDRNEIPSHGQLPDSADLKSHPYSIIHDLSGGGRLYSFYRDEELRLKDLKTVLVSHDSLIPVVRYEGNLVFSPAGQSTIINFNLPPDRAFASHDLTTDLPPNSVKLIADIGADGTPAWRPAPIYIHGDARLPVGLRLIASDNDGGFLPVGLGEPDENRWPFMRMRQKQAISPSFPYHSS
jgi:hypothetical protein